MNNTTTVQFLGRQFLVTIKSLFSGCSDCFHGLLCPVSWEGKEVCDCFWEFDGWRTYWHNYCLTQPLFLSSSFKMEERAAAVLAGFYPVFSSFNLFPFLYFSPFSFISNNFVSIYTVLYIPSPPLSLPISAWPCSKCTYCPHFPCLPSSLSPEQSPAVQPKDLFTQGKKKQRLCYQQCRVNALYFNLGRNTTLFEDCLFCLRSDFQCCKKHKLLSVCQDLQPKRNYYYGVGTFFFFV